MSHYTATEIATARDQARKARARADLLETRARRMEQAAREWEKTNRALFHATETVTPGRA